MRYVVTKELIKGTRIFNYCVTDSNTQTVICRYALKKDADDIAAKANERIRDDSNVS
jgi:hypothetical protein